jgi:hypothetical protein
MFQDNYHIHLPGTVTKRRGSGVERTELLNTAEYDPEVADVRLAMVRVKV